MTRPLSIVVVVLAAGALVGAVATAAANGAATVDERAERGEAVQIADTVPPSSTPYRLPVDPAAGPGWNPTHSSYPATDIFLPCGADIVAPVIGTVVHVRRDDAWDPTIDDPATRGGRSVAVLGVDGVRYYFAHFRSIDPTVEVGLTVAPGRYLGALGDSGRTSACHLHFGLSPDCPAEEWWVRRGVVWPAPYLDDWRDGVQTSPAREVATWNDANPGACADPAAIGAR